MAACLTWQRLVEHHLHLICTGRCSTPPQTPLHRLREGNDHSGIMLHAASDLTDVANKRDHRKGSWCGRCSSPYAASVSTSAALALAVDGWMAIWQIISYSHTTISSYQYRSIRHISVDAFHSDWWNSGWASALDHSTVTCSQEWFCRLLLQQNVYKQLSLSRETAWSLIRLALFAKSGTCTKLHFWVTLYGHRGQYKRFI